MSKECAFKRDEHYCIALSIKDREGCDFFKTPEDLERGREKAENRIATLPEHQQDHIRQKYKGLRSSVMVCDEGG